MTKYLIIGQGAAGTSAARTLRQIDPLASVTMISAESDWFYSRVDLPDIIAGKLSPEDAILAGREQFDALKIECRIGETARRIDPAGQAVELSSGARVPYDKLLLATGSEPVVPPMPGGGARGVHYLWTLADTRRILEASRAARSAVVVGAGLIGLKTALALMERGLEVAVVEKMLHVMPQQLDETAAAILADKVQGAGIQVVTGMQVNALETVDGKVTGVLLEQRRIVADMVVIAVGVRANVALGRGAGLEVGRGLVTNEFLETSAPGIYAAGDAAEIRDLLTGAPIVPATWGVAVEQGKVAALNMAGKRIAYDGAIGMNSVDIAGIPMISVGTINPAADDRQFTVQSGDTYRKVVVRGKQVNGVLFLGNVRQAGVAANLVLRRAEIGEIDILSSNFSFVSVMAQ
jgi:NAD(P)H-nitrite reductase large subunit